MHLSFLFQPEMHRKVAQKGRSTMLGQLILVRAAMGRSTPDLTRHAAVRCTLSRWKNNFRIASHWLVERKSSGDNSGAGEVKRP